MKMKSPLIWTVAFFFLSGIASAGQTGNANSGSWAGIIINGNCTVKEAFAEEPKCTEKGAPGAEMFFFDDTIGQVYTLDPQGQSAGHLGDSVTVTGTLRDNTIHVASLKLLTSFGLAVGQKAPEFSVRDQFGRQQTLETLHGPKGTVLLFVRSADW